MAILDPDLGWGEHLDVFHTPRMMEDEMVFLDPDLERGEQLDVFHIDRIKVDAGKRLFEHFAPMLQRLEGNAWAAGDVNAFYTSFPCAAHMHRMLHGEGGVLVDPWKSGFICVLPKNGNVGALPEFAKTWNWKDVAKLNKAAAFRVDPGSFSKFNADERLEATSCDIKPRVRAGATAELPPALSVKKYRLPGGNFVLCHVREGKISSRRGKNGTAGISKNGSVLAKRQRLFDG